MSRTSAPILMQRMAMEELGTSPDAPCILAVDISQAGVFEGAILDATIARVGGRSDQDVTVTYTWSGASVASDLAAPLTATVTLPANVMVLAIPKQTVVRAGSQSNRDVVVTLSAPVNCALSSSNYFADCQISDTPLAAALIGAFTVSNATATEGETITAQIKRVSGDAAATVTVGWLWSSSGGDADFAAGAVLSGFSTISSSVSQVNVSVVSATLAGTQGSRAINFELTSITNGAISPDAPLAVFTLRDFSPPPPVSVGVFASSTAKMPDDGSVDCVMNIKRLSGTGEITVNWQFTSSLHGFDFDPSGGPTGGPSGTATLAVGVNQVDVSANLRDRSGDTVGERTISCTISNAVGGNITTATASQILADGIVAPPSGVPKYQPTIPLNRQHWVGFTIPGQTPKKSYPPDRAGLVQALTDTSLLPGDVIVLDNVSYTGAKITIPTAKGGSATTDGSKHIMVRARTHGKATIDCQIEVNGAYWWFTGIIFTWTGGDTYFQNYNSAVISDNSGLWITNCKHAGHAFIHIKPNNSASNLRFCYNDVVCNTPAGNKDTSVFVTLYPYATSHQAPPDTEIAWNKVSLTVNPSPSDDTHARKVVMLHESHSTGADQTQFVTRTFKIHHNHCVGPWMECVYLKRNVCVEFNYFEWSAGTVNRYCGFRHGLLTSSPKYDSGGILRGNLLKSSNNVSLTVPGAGVTVVNNKIEGSSGKVLLETGNSPGNFVEDKPNRDGADNAQIVENFGFNEVRAYIAAADAHSAGPENAGGRNGWPSNVRIYKGDSDWSPGLTRDTGQDGKQCPAANFTIPYLAGYGAGTAAKCGTITVAGLTGANPPVGWDAPGTTPPEPPQPPTGTAPANTGDPSITGAATVGTTLTCNPGTWSGTTPITYSYTWRQTNGTVTTDIGIDAPTFLLTSTQLGLNIFCRVTATNSIGAAGKNTAQTAAVIDGTGPPQGDFVPAVQIMEVERVERAADIIDMSDTFKTNINGYYIRRSPPSANGGYDPAAAADPSGGVRPPPLSTYGLCANPINAALNKIYDFRECLGYQHDKRAKSGYPSPYTNHGYQYTLIEATGAGSNSVICGLKTWTRENTWVVDSWADLHGDDERGFNAPAIWISAAGGAIPAKWQGLYLKDCMDAIQPRADGWLIENIRASCRDDIIENDDQYSGTIRNGYLQGHVLLSMRPGGGSRTTANMHSVVVFEDCIIHMKRQPYDGDEGGDRGNPLSWFKTPYTNPDDANRNARWVTGDVAGKTWFNSKSCFKTQLEGSGDLYKSRVHMKNCLICMDSNAVEGEDQTFFPGTGDGSVVPGGSRTGSKYENVTLCVRAPGGWNALSSVQTSTQLENMGIKVINKTGTLAEERAADTAFRAAEAAWNLANGYDNDLTSQSYDTYSWNRAGLVEPPEPPTETSPTNTTDPSITGSAIVGQTLVCNPGVWNGTAPINYQYQWKQVTGSTTTDIANVTASLLLTSTQLNAKVFCRVTAVNSVGSAFENTAQTATVVNPAPPGAAEFVKYFALKIESAAANSIIRPSNFDIDGGNNVNCAGGKIIDWRGMGPAKQHEDGKTTVTAFTCLATGSGDACWTGGHTKAISAANLTGTWDELHGLSAPWSGAKNDKAVNMSNGQGCDQYIEGFYWDGAGMDGIGPPSSGSHNFRTYCNAIYSVDTRDDNCQNDSLYPVSFKNCYLQGHAILSQRPGGNADPAWTKFLTEYSYCLFHLKRQPYATDEKGNDGGSASSKRVGPYNGPSNRNATIVGGTNRGYGHKWFFKMASIGTAGFYKLRLKMSYCLLRIDTLPVEGKKIALFPPTNNTTDNGSFYDHVTVLWFGGAGGVGATWDNTFSQSKATLANMGITVLEADTLAHENEIWALWNLNADAFKTANGWNGTNFAWNRP